MNDKTTIQINKNLRDTYKTLCNKLGWNISGRVEYFIRQELSGSMNVNQ